MTGEDIKRAFRDEILRLNKAAERDGRPRPYALVSLAAHVQDPDASGMPDLCIVGPWRGRTAKVELECKSPREALLPDQAAYAELAQRVSGDGYFYAIVRQTPRAAGELSAVQAAVRLGLVELATRLPKPGPGAVIAERPAGVGHAGIEVWPDDLTAGEREAMQHWGPWQREAYLKQRVVRKGGAR